MAYLDFSAFVDLLDEIFEVDDPEEIKWDLSTLSTKDTEAFIEGTLSLSAIRRHFNVGDTLSITDDTSLAVILKESGESDLMIRIHLNKDTTTSPSSTSVSLPQEKQKEVWVEFISSTPTAKLVSACLGRC